jgi:outer membrane protein OmpA-like peptidoglycan-associated protein
MKGTNMKATLKVFVILAVVGLTGCLAKINNFPVTTFGSGDREVNAVLIADPVAPNVAEIREKVLFNFDSAVLDDQAMSIVKRVAQAMKDAPDTDLALAGHTDKYGSDEYNVNLSISRAEAVADALIVEGVEAERIIDVAGFGKAQLLPQLTNRENRRVLILSFDE